MNSDPTKSRNRQQTDLVNRYGEFRLSVVVAALRALGSITNPTDETATGADPDHAEDKDRETPNR